MAAVDRGGREDLPNVYTSNATVKTAGDETIVIASSVGGIRKINATGESFDLASFLPYPGLEALSAKATPEALEAALTETDAAVREGRRDDSRAVQDVG